MPFDGGARRQPLSEGTQSLKYARPGIIRDLPLTVGATAVLNCSHYDAACAEAGTAGGKL